MATGNGKIKAIMIETSLVLTLCGVIWGIAWGAICENRKDIKEVREVLFEKVSIIQQDVAFIKAKVGQ